jgi:hypothetical protein
MELTDKQSAIVRAVTEVAKEKGVEIDDTAIQSFVKSHADDDFEEYADGIRPKSGFHIRDWFDQVRPHYKWAFKSKDALDAEDRRRWDKMTASQRLDFANTRGK